YTTLSRAIDILHFLHGFCRQMIGAHQLLHSNLHVGIRYYYLRSVLIFIRPNANGPSVLNEDLPHGFISNHLAAVILNKANHRHTQHSTASPRMFGPALVQHRLPAGKIAGSGMVGRRPRLGRKPGECRLHMWAFESIIYHFAVAAEYFL